MRRSLKILIILFTIIVFVLTSCNLLSKPDSQMPETMPGDFGFVLYYGVTVRNSLDTIKGTYTKDLVMAPPVTTDLRLSDGEMAGIYQMMRDIAILDYPEIYDPETDVEVSPYVTYNIEITLDGQTKSIHWDDKGLVTIAKATALRNLFERIHEIVIAKDEYKQLPPIQGGYD